MSASQDPTVPPAAVATTAAAIAATAIDIANSMHRGGGVRHSHSSSSR